MSKATLAEIDQKYFEDVEVGARIPEREFGPHKLVTAVFWAGVQENPGLLHLDREHARAHRGAKSIVASGSLRQSFLAQTVTDWAGPRAFLSSMEIRHTASTFENDMQRYSGVAVEKSPLAEQPWITFELDGRNQDGAQIIRGRCTVLLPRRDQAIDRPVWES